MYKFNGGKGAIVCEDCRMVIMENPPSDAKVDNTYCPACQEKLLNYCGYFLRDDCDMRSEEPDAWEGYIYAWSLCTKNPFGREAVYACHPDRYTKEAARLWALNLAFDEALVQFKFLRNEPETEKEFKQRMRQGMNHHVPLCQRCKE